MPLTRLQARDRTLRAVSDFANPRPQDDQNLSPSTSITLAPLKRHHAESRTGPLSTTRSYTEHSYPSHKKRKRGIPKGFVAPLSTHETKTQQFPIHNDIEDASSLPSLEAARQVLSLLRSFYSRPLSTPAHLKTEPRKTVLDSLVATILSQATSNLNSSRAFRNLKARFPSWESAMAAGPKEIETCITCGGLARSKSQVLYNILTRLKREHGECSLEFIHDMTTDNAKTALCSFKGVGPKTASCVLMFALRRAEFPVDTHVCRLASRLGWMPPASTPERTYESLNSCLPDDVKHELHVLLIEHGRRTCKANSPRCVGCPLMEMCRFQRKK